MVHLVIALSGFVGAWLLVAGPLFQAAVELSDSEERRDQFVEATRRLGPVPRMSPWWWLLPPVAYVKQRRLRRDYQKRLFDSLSADEVETFVEYSNVSTGWAMVALGACFIALKETYELVEVLEWPGWLVVVLVLVMLLGCALNTVLRVRRAHGMVDEAKARTATARAAA